MFVQNDMPVLDSIGYANQVLDTFYSPIALERPEALLFMQVGGQRMTISKQLLKRMRQHLQLGQERPRLGARMELLLGEFGCGKSHLGYLLKHDCINGMQGVLTAHVQITNESRWNATLAALLRNLRLSGIPPMLVGDVEISLWRELLSWCNDQPSELLLIARNAAGTLSSQVVDEFVRALVPMLQPMPDVSAWLNFIDQWVMTTSNKIALQVLEMILRVLGYFEQRRLVLIIDEFEAIDSLDDRSKKETLQCFQDLYDDLAGRVPGLPASFILLLSTPDWAHRAANMLPSLLGQGQRLRMTSQLQEFTPSDIAALAYRYMMLLHLSHDDVRCLDTTEIHNVIQEVLEEQSAYMHQVRTLHVAVRDKLLTHMLAK